MKTLLLAILLSLLTGCYTPYAGPHPPMPNQDQAEKIVMGVAGFDGPVPPIVWRVGDSCFIYGSNYAGYWLEDGICVGGFYSENYDYAEVEWRGTFSGSSYAHEIAHAVLEYQHGTPDDDHTSSFFSYRGTGYGGDMHEAPGSFVSDANLALVAAGL